MEKLDGVKEAKVDFQAKEVQVTYMPNKVDSDALTSTINKTSHMMGADYKYIATVK